LTERRGDLREKSADQVRLDPALLVFTPMRQNGESYQLSAPVPRLRETIDESRERKEGYQI